MSIVHRIVDGVYELRRKVDSEETFVRSTLRKHHRDGARLLDVGCGFGRFHRIVADSGWQLTGVDVNPEAVLRGVAESRDVRDASGFHSGPEFDAILLAHIVEHFDTDSLIALLARYLEMLRPGGIVIILTPLMHCGFYDDFDHVKPYNPEAIRQMLCRSTPQTRPFALPGEYDEIDLWIKRDPLWHSYWTSRANHLFNIPLTLAAVASFGLIAKVTGYGMVLRRTA